MHRPLHLVENEHRWPSMMMDGLFVVWLQGYFKHAKPLVLEVIAHVTLASSVERV
ncbi:MAG: hypothetical protein WB839_05310 [Pseudolabrys sp.]